MVVGIECGSRVFADSVKVLESPQFSMIETRELEEVK